MAGAIDVGILVFREGLECALCQVCGIRFAPAEAESEPVKRFVIRTHNVFEPLSIR